MQSQRKKKRGRKKLKQSLTAAGNMISSSLTTYLFIFLASGVFSQSLNFDQSSEGFQAPLPAKKYGQMALHTQTNTHQKNKFE